MRILIALLLLTIFCISSVCASEQRITNGDFTNGLSGWLQSHSEAGTWDIQITQVSSGDSAANLVAATTSSIGKYAQIAQYVDFTGCEALTFKTETDSTTSRGQMEVSIGDDLVRTVYMGSYDVSIDVTSYSGTHLLAFRCIAAGGTIGYPARTDIDVYQISCLVTQSTPVLHAINANPTQQALGQPVGVLATYTAGNPAATSFYWDWNNDGVYDLTTTSPSATIPGNTYATPGAYTVKCQVGNAYGFGNSVTTTVGIKPTASFTASPTSGQAPLTVQFTPSVNGAQSLLWTFGDGTTSAESYPAHTYTTNGIYDVTLNATGPGGTTTVIQENLITVSDQFIRWNKTSYQSGETAEISWQLLNYDTSQTNQIRIYQTDQYGNLQTLASTITLSSATGSESLNTTGLSGDYIAVWFANGAQQSVTAITSIISYHTLTVKITDNGITWTDNTTISITGGGTEPQTNTTNTGTATFTVTTGTYTISASTEGKTAQSITQTITADATITIDWTTGTSSNTIIGGGSGSMYASTFITFRVIDRITGAPLQGATVTAIGTEATNPISWIGQLFGYAWGDDILETQLSGTTDPYGAITFAMFQGINYRVTTTYQALPENVQSFTPSALNTEYPIRLDLPRTISAPSSQTILTIVSASQSTGTISVNYNDTTRTTSNITTTLYVRNTIDQWELIQTLTSIGSDVTQTLQPQSYSGKNYRVHISAETGTYGTITREYGITFDGPRIDLGIPDGLYLWICFAIALLIGASATYVSANYVVIAIVVIEWALYAMGWLYELGTNALIALILATILAILFNIGSK